MRRVGLLAAFMALGFWGCSSDSKNTEDTTIQDTAQDAADVTADVPEEDLGVPDAIDDLAADEIEPLDVKDDVEDVVVPPKTRLYTFKGIGGMSMGAGALTLHVNHQGIFDHVSANGGYINYDYLADFFRRAFFGGFCDMETILAHLDEVDDPNSVALKCGPVPARDPWEFDVDFNHWHPDNSGGTWDRDFYWEAIEGIATAFGNIANYNPDHPYLPAGVPVEWAAPGDTTERCANPVKVGKPNNYNAEYNPDGTYDLVTFCDGEEPIPGGKDNPDYWTLMGVYDPTYAHTRPVNLMLAVDFNGNGKRDMHEPLVLNMMERFSDFGVDGCADALEDGNGGCTANSATGDPNGDNYDLETNYKGTEGNNLYDAGELYEDFGLDGVNGTADFGEGDGEFNLNPNVQAVMDRSAMHWIKNATQEELDAVDVSFDGGIRDALHALTATWGLAKAMLDREPNTKFFMDFTRFDDSLCPLGKDTTIDTGGEKCQLTASAIGKNFIVGYGNPDATAAEIDKGDGKHVGTGNEIYNRAWVMMVAPLKRWPGIDWEACSKDGGTQGYSTFYSPGLQNRYGFAYSLPPCYEADAAAGKTYPVYIYLLGHGMMANDSIAVGLVFNMLMKIGKMGKFILVIPEGQCCRIHKTTGERYCGCHEKVDADGWFCSDPKCTGTHEECEEFNIAKGDLVQECNGGHFFANQKSNKWGDLEAAKLMKYEDVVFDLVDHLNATFRVRQPETVTIP